MSKTVKPFCPSFGVADGNYIYLLAWLHEDLRGGSLPACLDGSLASHPVAAAGSNNEPSIITILFQGMHKHVISCGNCQLESVSSEPVTILSLALPVSGNSTLKRLLHDYYEDPSLLINDHSAARKEKALGKQPSRRCHQYSFFT